ncbi:hypothetical protein AAFF_G00133720 [Aldrovandia affinis]|uniref:TMEM205-like domain-containing protein n=1 Tax=Aldrovandia affinis TaxID=143900 RepID=A0AAD7W938_9TELE|nr:hypothetical protein AAFF_G00133720 [Aldrovandia affinis]
MKDCEEIISAHLLHLILISTFWGMQIWYTLSSFVMDCVMNKHIYGHIQSRLLPFYYRIGSTCAFVSLIIFGQYHPHNQLGDEEDFQVFILLVCVMAAALNSHYFGAVTSEIMADMHHIELSSDLGKNIWLSACSEAYDKLYESNSEYKKLSCQLWRYHWMSSLCNLCCIICNCFTLYYLAQNTCLP